MKTLKLISVFVFLTIVKADSQNLNITTNSVDFMQTRNQRNNSNFDNVQQQVIIENVDFNKASQIPNNPIAGNEQKQTKQLNLFQQNEDKSTETKSTISLKMNLHLSPKVYHSKKKTHYFKHWLFKTSRKMDSFFAKQVKKKPVYVCAVW